jgi:hypothetical protein
LIVGAIRELQKVKCSFSQSYPEIGIRDRRSPYKQKFDLLAVIIWRRHKPAPARFGHAPLNTPMHATLQQDFVFSRILISVSRISTMRATKFGRGSDLGNHDLGRAGSWQQLLSGAVSHDTAGPPRQTRAAGSGGPSMQPLMNDQPQPPCGSVEYNST